MIFDYVFRHMKDGDFRHWEFDLFQIEGHEAREVIGWFREDGYELIARRLYTGLKDNNGKNIFIWDIISFPYGNFKVEFCEGCFGAYDGSGFSPFRGTLWGEGGLVIGNIYEHPHLLKDKE